ncbi:MAG: hypothetical protein ACREDK_03645 [Thermoplasmata archaeon]
MYVATIVAMLAMVGGWALATTTITTGPAESTNITTSQPAGFSTATVASTQVVKVNNAIAAYTAAGTQSSDTSGLAGTTASLTPCAAACAENYITVNGNTITAGDYAQQIVFTVTQPVSTATGFDIQVQVTMNTNVLVFGNAYFDTNFNSQSSTSTVTVYLFVDLGVGGVSAPTISSISVQFNGCLSTTSCP